MAATSSNRHKAGINSGADKMDVLGQERGKAGGPQGGRGGLGGGGAGGGGGGQDGGGGAGAYNPASGTFHSLGSGSGTDASGHPTGRFRSFDDAGDASSVGQESDSLSNTGSCSGESEDQLGNRPGVGGAIGGGPGLGAAAGASAHVQGVPAGAAGVPGAGDKKDKIRAKNEKKHLRQKEKKAQELRDKCTGFLTARKLELLAEQLVAMGFPKDRCMVALVCCDGSLERSVTWLLEGGGGNDAATGKSPTAATLKLDLSAELTQIAELENKHGFPRADIERAVIACEGDVDKAASTLLEKQRVSSHTTGSSGTSTTSMLAGGIGSSSSSSSSTSSSASEGMLLGAHPVPGMYGFPGVSPIPVQQPAGQARSVPGAGFPHGLAHQVRGGAPGGPALAAAGASLTDSHLKGRYLNGQVQPQLLQQQPPQLHTQHAAPVQARAMQYPHQQGSKASPAGTPAQQYINGATVPIGNGPGKASYQAGQQPSALPGGSQKVQAPKGGRASAPSAPGPQQNFVGQSFAPQQHGMGVGPAGQRQVVPGTGGAPRQPLGAQQVAQQVQAPLQVQQQAHVPSAIQQRPQQQQQQLQPQQQQQQQQQQLLSAAPPPQQQQQQGQPMLGSAVQHPQVVQQQHQHQHQQPGAAVPANGKVGPVAPGQAPGPANFFDPQQTHQSPLAAPGMASLPYGPLPVHQLGQQHLQHEKNGFGGAPQQLPAQHTPAHMQQQPQQQQQQQTQLARQLPQMVGLHPDHSQGPGQGMGQRPPGMSQPLQQQQQQQQQQIQQGHPSLGMSGQGFPAPPMTQGRSQSKTVGALGFRPMGQQLQQQQQAMQLNPSIMGMSMPQQPFELPGPGPAGPVPSMLRPMSFSDFLVPGGFSMGNPSDAQNNIGGSGMGLPGPSQDSGAAGAGMSGDVAGAFSQQPLPQQQQVQDGARAGGDIPLYLRNPWGPAASAGGPLASSGLMESAARGVPPDGNGVSSGGSQLPFWTTEMPYPSGASGSAVPAHLASVFAPLPSADQQASSQRAALSNLWGTGLGSNVATTSSSGSNSSMGGGMGMGSKALGGDPFHSMGSLLPVEHPFNQHQTQQQQQQNSVTGFSMGHQQQQAQTRLLSQASDPASAFQSSWSPFTGEGSMRIASGGILNLHGVDWSLPSGQITVGSPAPGTSALGPSASSLAAADAMGGWGSMASSLAGLSLSGGAPLLGGKGPGEPRPDSGSRDSSASEGSFSTAHSGSHGAVGSSGSSTSNVSNNNNNNSNSNNNTSSISPSDNPVSSSGHDWTTPFAGKDFTSLLHGSVPSTGL